MAKVSYPRARKRFGQHFLEPAWVTRLVNLVEPDADDTFLEIGPGRGALTGVLAPRVKRVIAVEIDRDLAAALPATVPANVTVVEGDVLAVDVAGLLRDGYSAGLLREARPTEARPTENRPARVIGNLPYNISSPVLFKLLGAAEDGRLLSDATLMLQKEVVDRLIASPGSGDYGTLAIQVARVADVERLLTLPPGAFRPPPQVTSAVVRLRFRPPAVDVGDVALFEKVVRGMFLQRRKMLGNALKPVAHARGRSAGDVLECATVDGHRRPETLTLDEIARICRAML
jgi:16S rRNA (adenine1518-N6/adenine1519-N6)-dimethyltransferase